MNKKILSLILTGVLCFILVGCSNTNTSDNKVKEDIKEEVIENHKIGDSTYMDEDKKVMVSVTNVRKVEKDVLGNDAEEGVYAVEVEIVNNSDNDVESDFINNYRVKDSNNYECGQLLNYDLKGDLMYDTIRPGETLRGEIAYDVKDGATPVTMEIDLGLGYYTIFDLE